MRSSVRFVVIASVFAAASVHAQQVYKWVDEKGKVQYGDQPPDKLKAAPVTVTPGPANAPAAKPDDWKQKDLEFQKRKIERDRQEQGAGSQQQVEANRAATCAHSRRRLELLQEQIPIYQRNDKGERVYIEDKDRERIMGELRGTIAENCK